MSKYVRRQHKEDKILAQVSSKSVWSGPLNMNQIVAKIDLVSEKQSTEGLKRNAILKSG